MSKEYFSTYACSHYCYAVFPYASPIGQLILILISWNPNIPID